MKGAIEMWQSNEIDRAIHSVSNGANWQLIWSDLLAASVSYQS